MPASRTTHVERFSVSLDKDLLSQFDQYRSERGYSTRSEAIRDLIRERLIQRAVADPDSDVVGTLTIVFDHNASDLSRDLTNLQHHHHDTVVCTTHVHLNHEDCLEVTVLRGKGRDVESLAAHLVSHKGVKHGHLGLTLARPQMGDPDEEA